MQPARPITLRSYSTKELGDIYCVSKKVMSKWLKLIDHKLGKRNGWYYNIRQVKMIFDHLGEPPDPAGTSSAKQ